MEPLRIVIAERQAGRRLDAVVAESGAMSRGRVAELVSAGVVTVDGRTRAKSYRVRPGEAVEVGALEPVARTPAPEIPVVYGDESLLVVEKPAGVVVHAAPGLGEESLVDALARAGHDLAPGAGEGRPGVVHRLDRDVSGLLLVAKTDEAHERLVASLAARTITREYLALVAGAPGVDTGKIEAPLARDPRHRTRMAVSPGGRRAVTWFRVRERLAEASLLEVRLETGRTHQIRTHLASIDHPVLGDAVYGRDPGLGGRLGLDRPFLHAFRLGFTHPLSGEPVELTSELPSVLRRALARARSG